MHPAAYYPFDPEPVRAEQADGLDPLIRLWILRILVPLGGMNDLLRHSFDTPNLLVKLGLPPESLDGTESAQRAKDAHTAVGRLWKRAERTAAKAAVPATLRSNIQRLQALLQLSPTECRILEFACLIHTVRDLDDAADHLGPLQTHKVQQVLERILDLPQADVKLALSPTGQLVRSGLLNVTGHGSSLLRVKLDLLGDHFADTMLASDVDPMALLKGVVIPSLPARLQLEDYPHLGLNLQMLTAYLQESLAQQKPGVNILLYGPPGTGKTELTRTLAQSMGCALYEASTEDEDGDPINGTSRLRAYRVAQRFLERRQVMILFDEIEDVFGGAHPSSFLSSLFQQFDKGQQNKGWVNKALEANPVPTFWLTNAIHMLDPAYIRRFDFVLEMPVPPLRVREKMAATALGARTDAATLRALASSEDMAPAVLTRATSVLQTLQTHIPAEQSNTALLQLVNNTLQAQGHARVKASDPSRLPDLYDPAVIHTDTDVAAMVAGIERAGSARLCLYGPPGTGKTAYARWLAQQLGRPLLVKRSSDLLDKYVGESEKHIAGAFRQAENDDAVLLIDEVDSFLQDRRGAARSWEVTQVNEMLTQMESYSGVFIATTNLMDGLDPAALRRFDLKVRFDYLTPAQAWTLFQRQCQALGLPEPDAVLRQNVQRLRPLAPGDFAAVVRRHRFQPLKHARDLLQALEDECALKSDHHAAIGFI